MSLPFLSQLRITSKLLIFTRRLGAINPSFLLHSEDSFQFKDLSPVFVNMKRAQKLTIDDFFKRPAKVAKKDDEQANNLLAEKGVGKKKINDVETAPLSNNQIPDDNSKPQENSNKATFADYMKETDSTTRIKLLAQILKDQIKDENWKRVLMPEFAKPEFQKLLKQLDTEYQSKTTIYPAFENIFAALSACPLKSVKVVIIGQDPYFNPGQAHGLSFSVLPGAAIPSSLQNIYKELADNIDGFKKPTHGYLGSWAKQGVLLLNASLTVKAGAPSSHQNYWKGITDACIRAVSERSSKKVVFLLWGNFAKTKGAMVNKKHHILTAAHPSGLSASRGFFGCKHFSKANSFLEEDGETPINWLLPN